MEEISGIAERGHEIVLVEHMFDSLLSQWEKAKEHDIFYNDFVVIRSVTLLENQIRQTIRRMVNLGEPYRSNGTKIIRKWPQETLIDSMLAIKDERITFGAFIAHGISVNTVEAIMSNLESVFGDGFKSELAASTTRWTEEVERGDALNPLIEDLGKTIEWVKKLLEARHIVVHEITKESSYSNEDVPMFVLHANQFATALQWLVVYKKWGTVPMFQTTMNRIAEQNVEQAQRRLDELRGGRSEDFKTQESLSDKVEFHWDKFCEYSAEKRAKENKGGNIYPVIYGGERERLLLWRISDIAREKELEKLRRL